MCCPRDGHFRRCPRCCWLHWGWVEVSAKRTLAGLFGSRVSDLKLWRKKIEKWKTISKSSVIVVSAFYGRVTDNLARRPSVHVNSVPLTRGWTLGSSINDIIFFKGTKEGDEVQKSREKLTWGRNGPKKRSRKIVVMYMDSPCSCWKDQKDKRRA